MGYLSILISCSLYPFPELNWRQDKCVGRFRVLGTEIAAVLYKAWGSEVLALDPEWLLYGSILCIKE